MATEMTTARFNVSTYGSNDRWSFQTSVHVGSAALVLSDSEHTYQSEELAQSAGDLHLATTLRDAVVAALAPRI